jgi:hypothetical protein
MRFDLIFLRSRYHAPVAATQNARQVGGQQHVGNRTQTTGLNMIVVQSVGTKAPFSSQSRLDCIQLLFTDPERRKRRTQSDHRN